jgi:hypothetical protein
VLRREPSIDFQSAGAARFDGVPDLDVLRFAADADRILPQDVSISCVIESSIIVWVASEAREMGGKDYLAPAIAPAA